MRTLSTAAAAAMAAASVPLALLVEMDLSSPLNLNTSNLDLVVSGTTYYGTKGLGRIGALQDTAAELRGLQFELSGVPSDLLSLALTEPVQGKAVRIKTAVFDPDTYAALDVRLRWAGRLDVMAVNDGEQSATISVTAEHAGIDLVRPASSLYTDAEQQRLAPGDLFLQFLAEQVEQRVVWPAREFFLRK